MQNDIQGVILLLGESLNVLHSNETKIQFSNIPYELNWLYDTENVISTNVDFYNICISSLENGFRSCNGMSGIRLKTWNESILHYDDRIFIGYLDVDSNIIQLSKLDSFTRLAFYGPPMYRTVVIFDFIDVREKVRVSKRRTKIEGKIFFLFFERHN
jgi:hypothetical protein